MSAHRGGDGTLPAMLERLLKAARPELINKVDKRIAEELQGYFGRKKAYGALLGGGVLLFDIAKIWNERLRDELRRQTVGEKMRRVSILCAFEEMLDQVISRSGMERLVKWAEQQPVSKPRGKRPRTQSGGAANVCSWAEFCAALCQALENPASNKLTLKGEFRAEFQEHIRALTQAGTVMPGLGGAAGIVAEVLAQFSSDVTLFSMYRAVDMDQHYRGEPKRLTGTPRVARTGEPDGVKTSGHAPAPLRQSVVFPFKEGQSMTIQGRCVTAKRDDRVIMRDPNYCLDCHDMWQVVSVNAPSAVGPIRVVRKLEPDQWPFYSGFIRWAISNRVLHFEYLDRGELEGWGRFPYVFLSAPGLKEFRPEPADPVERVTTAALLEQLDVLRVNGSRLHVEISGVDQENDCVAGFAKGMKGRIHSLGIGDGELKALSGLRDWTPPLVSTMGTGEVFQRYEIARHVAKALDLERLYVHGNEVDLILRRGNATQIRADRDADLVAKGVVVLAVLQRTAGDWEGYLRVENVYDEVNRLIHVAQDIRDKRRAAGAPRGEHARFEQIARQGQKQLERVQDLTQARLFAEAKDLASNLAEQLKNDLEHKRWQSKMAPPLFAAVTAQGLRALIEFARDYAGCTPGGRHRDGYITDAGAEVFKQLTQDGYVAAEPPEYSLAVVPVMWPKLGLLVNSTGSGDITSGVCFAYSEL